MRLGVLIAVLVIVGSWPWPAVAQQRVFLAIATGGTAGVYFPLGAALAEIWSSKVPGVQATAQSSGASVANINLLARGDVGVGFVQNDIALYAFNGTEMFMDRINNRPQPVSNLRGMAMLYPEIIQVVALRGRGISSIADLRDRRFAVGAPGSGTEVNARQILRLFGLGYFNIREDFLNFAEAADQYPYYVSVAIPPGTYRGQDRAVETAAVMAMLATRQEMDEQLIYNLTSTLWENLDRLQAAHARGKDITTATSRRGMPITMHAGALRYYRERGIK